MINQAKSILTKLNIPFNNLNYLAIREMLKNRDGYVGLFTKLHFIENTPIDSLMNLKACIETQPQLIQTLSKPLVQFDKLEPILDAIEESRINYGVKNVINEFPNKQKELIDIKNDRNTLFELYLRKDRAIFFSKLALYKSRKELQQAVSSFLSNRVYDRKRLLQICREEKINIIHDDPEKNILIIIVNTHDQIRKVASDSSWCIVREASTFRNYNPPGSKQYVIFLLDKDVSDSLRKIGLTVGPRNVNKYHYHTAHDIRDRRVPSEELNRILNSYSYDLEKLKIKKHEFSINDHDVDILLVSGFSREEILKSRQRYSAKDLKKFEKEEIQQYKLLEKTEINGIDLFKKLSVQEIIDQNMIVRVQPGTLTIDHLLMLGKEFFEKEPEMIFSKIANVESTLDFLKNELKKIPNNYTEYRTETNWLGLSWLGRREYSPSATFLKLTWHGFRDVGSNNGESEYLDKKLDVDQLAYILRDSYFRTEAAKEKFKILNNFLNFTKESYERFYDKIYNNAFYEKYINLINTKDIHGFDYRNDFLQVLNLNIDKGMLCLLEQHHIDEIRKMFSEQELINFNVHQYGMKFSKDANTKYHLASKYNDISKVQAFYDKYHTFIENEFQCDKKVWQKDSTFNAVRTGWNRGINHYINSNNETILRFDFEDKIQTYVIFIYGKLDKLHELNPNVFNLKFSYYNSSAVLLAHGLTGEFKTNGDFDLEFTSEQKKKIYQWFMQNLFNLKKEPKRDSKGKIIEEIVDINFANMYYMFDKDRWNDYISRVKKVRKRVSRPRFFYIYKIVNQLILNTNTKLIPEKHHQPFFETKELDQIIEMMKGWKIKYKEMLSSYQEIANISTNNLDQFFVKNIFLLKLEIMNLQNSDENTIVEYLSVLTTSGRRQQFFAIDNMVRSKSIGFYFKNCTVERKSKLVIFMRDIIQNTLQPLSNQNTENLIKQILKRFETSD